MDAHSTRVETGMLCECPEQHATFQGAPAPGNCQRKSSRGAGAAPLQGFGARPKLQQQAEPTLSSFLRDNSDLTNEVNPVSGERVSGILRVEESGGATGGEPEFLSECSPRDKPWDGHRADADQIAEMYTTHPDFLRLAERVGLCSLKLGFAWVRDRQDANALTLKLRDAHFCRVRHCPICQWRRCLMWLARFYVALPRVLAAHPTARFVFLTLTRQNVQVRELRATLRAMNKAWERLAQRKSFGVVLGWIRTTEVTRGKDGTAHPHFHVLLMVPSSYFTKRYLSQAEWAEMWRKALRLDYTPVVDIRAVKAATVNGSGILPALRETLKYCVKPSDMKADVWWFLEITRQLWKLKFIASGGVLKGVLRAEKESEKDLLLLRDADPSDESASQLASLFFNWHRQPRRYKRANAAVRKDH
jgi:plasmid rolling circle replication initiator protein Rep